MTKEETKKYLMNMREAINVLEKELCEDISEDGTLTVNVEDGTKVSRVFVCGDNHFGGLYYPEQEPCVDAISRREAIKKITYNGKGECIPDYDCDNFPVQIAMKTVKKILRELPPVKPQYTDAEIQKMQDLESVEIQTAYELGKAEVQPCEDAISRQAVLDMLEDINAETEGVGFYYKHYVEYIKQLPSVTSQPREDAEPAQVYLEGDGYADGQIVYDWGKCPKCGWEFENGDKDWEEPYCCHCGQKLHWFEDAADEGSSENPNKWIPVSERLPEEYGEYLITWTTSQSERSFIEICECEVTSEYDYEHERFEVEWLLEDYIKAYPNVEVIAWMPLPKPFEGNTK